MFTARMVAQHVIKLTGQNHVEIDVMNDCNAIVQMEPETTIVHAAQALHNARLLDSQAAEITCLLSSRQSVVNVVYERDHAWQWLQQLEAETWWFQQEQMVELLQKFGSEVKKVEELQCRVEWTKSILDEGKTCCKEGRWNYSPRNSSYSSQD